LFPPILWEYFEELSEADRPRLRAAAAALVRGGKTADARKAAVQALRLSRTADVEALRPAFDDPDPEVRRFVVNDVLRARSPAAAVPLVARPLRRPPSRSLNDLFTPWLNTLGSLPPEALAYVAEVMCPTYLEPAYPTAVDRLPSGGLGGRLTAPLV